MIRAYGMRGLLGTWFSRGIDEFAEKLKPFVDTVDVRGFSQWDSIRHDIEDRQAEDRLADAKIILFGHSMGANRATEIAQQTTTRIDLLIAFDPTWMWPIQLIGNNVDRAICFYGRGASIAGRGRLKTTLSSQAHITNIPTYLLHTFIDDDDPIQEQALDAVKMLKRASAKRVNGNG